MAASCHFIICHPERTLYLSFSFFSSPAAVDKLRLGRSPPCPLIPRSEKSGSKQVPSVGLYHQSSAISLLSSTPDLNLSRAHHHHHQHFLLHFLHPLSSRLISYRPREGERIHAFGRAAVMLGYTQVPPRCFGDNEIRSTG